MKEVSAWEAAYRRFETPEQEVRKFVRRLRKVGSDHWPRQDRILELFCGRGNGLVALERLGFTNIYGVDMSRCLLASYRGRGRAIVADCRALPVHDGMCDVAIVQGGLHHLQTLPDDLERVLGEVCRTLAPRGLFVAVEPWRTPFLDSVHRVGCSAVVRRLWGRMDALATMIEHERETYERWLGAPHQIRAVLAGRFEPVLQDVGWGKLVFVGRKQAC